MTRQQAQESARKVCSPNRDWPQGQAVAWLWQNIAHPIRDPDIVARSLTEMDPANPPYPEYWKPVGPLYTHPPAQPVCEYRRLDAGATEWGEWEVFNGHKDIGSIPPNTRFEYRNVEPQEVVEALDRIEALVSNPARNGTPIGDCGYSVVIICTALRQYIKGAGQ